MATAIKKTKALPPANDPAADLDVPAPGMGGPAPDKAVGGGDPGAGGPPMGGPPDAPKVEKYSAQVIRRFHELAGNLLSEGDQMLDVLEHDEVGGWVTKKLEACVEEMEELEAMMDKHHPDAGPLHGRPMPGEEEEGPEFGEDLGEAEPVSGGPPEEEVGAGGLKHLNGKAKSVCPKCGMKGCSCAGKKAMTEDKLSKLKKEEHYVEGEVDEANTPEDKDKVKEDVHAVEGEMDEAQHSTENSEEEENAEAAKETAEGEEGSKGLLHPHERQQVGEGHEFLHKLSSNPDAPTDDERFGAYMHGEHMDRAAQRLYDEHNLAPKPMESTLPAGAPAPSAPSGGLGTKDMDQPPGDGGGEDSGGEVEDFASGGGDDKALRFHKALKEVGGHLKTVAKSGHMNWGEAERQKSAVHHATLKGLLEEHDRDHPPKPDPGMGQDAAQQSGVTEPPQVANVDSAEVMTKALLEDLLKRDEEYGKKMVDFNRNMKKLWDGANGRPPARV